MNQNRSKYKNIDVSANTVHNLLQTINSMSQRCKIQTSTDSELQRIRSIIHMYRPNLSNRHDLQTPELLIEAFMQDSNKPNQITHNFNYKYDYNTNAPHVFNPFPAYTDANVNNNNTVPVQTQPSLQTFNLYNQPTPQQSTQPQSQQPTQNTMPLLTTQQQQQPSTPQPPPPPPPSNTTIVTMTVPDEDMMMLNNYYMNARRSPTIVNFKQLLQSTLEFSRKYIQLDVFLASLETLLQFDQLIATTTVMKSDLQELLLCIQRETNWLLPNGPSVCLLLSILIVSYCRIATIVTRQTFILSTIRTEEQLRVQIEYVENAIQSLVNASATATNATPTPMEVVINDSRTANELAVAQRNLAVLQEELTSIRVSNEKVYERLDQETNKNLQLTTALRRLIQYSQNNISELHDITSTVVENNPDIFIDRLIETITANKSTVTSLTADVLKFQKRLGELERTNVELTTSLNSQIASHNSADVQNENQIQMLQNQVSENKRIIEDLKETNESYKNIHSKQQLKIDNLNSQIQKMMHSADKKIAKLSDQLTLANEQLLQSKADSEKHVAQLLQENERLLYEIEQHKKYYDDLNTRYEKLLNQYSKLQKSEIMPRKSSGVSKISRTIKPSTRSVTARRKSSKQSVVSKLKVLDNNDDDEQNENDDVTMNDEVEQEIDLSKVINAVADEMTKMKSRIQMLAEQQSSLSPEDLTMLNSQSVQAMTDKLSEVSAQNKVLQDACASVIAKESQSLFEKLSVNQLSFDERIKNVENQLVPLKNNIEQAVQSVAEYEDKYEKLARISAMQIE